MARQQREVMAPSRREVLAGAGSLVAASTLPARRAQAGPRPMRLQRGMNLWPWFSLTRERPAPSRDYDWPPFQASRAVPGRDDLERLRELGFDFVRIPVDPGPLLAFAGRRREALLGDVTAAARLALDAGLAVVVDLHPNEATHYWTAARFAADPAAPEAAGFVELVALVAAALARLDPERVALEPVNEPPGACDGGAWRAMQARLVASARAAAPELSIVINGACGALLAGLEALDPAPFRGPGFLYSFHFYEPYVFSHQGAPWMTGEPMYRYLNAVPWPSSAGSLARTLAAVERRMAADLATPPPEKRRIRATIDGVLRQYFAAHPGRGFIVRHLERAAAWADRHAIARDRMLMGEFGALRSDQRYVAALAGDRARYIRDVRETAEALGFAWAFWNYFDGMGLVVDDQSRRIDPAIAAALGIGS